MRPAHILLAATTALAACQSGGSDGITISDVRAQRAALLLTGGCIQTDTEPSAATNYFTDQGFTQTESEIRNTTTFANEGEGIGAMLSTISAPGVDGTTCAVILPGVTRASAGEVFRGLQGFVFEGQEYATSRPASGATVAYTVDPAGNLEEVSWQAERLDNGLPVVSFTYAQAETSLTLDQIRQLRSQ